MVADTVKPGTLPRAVKAAPLWAWGLGLGAAAGGTAALYNARRARRTEEANPPAGEFIEVDGVRLHYLARGTGPLIVLLHGNGTMVEDWLASGVFDRLATNTRVIAFDRPGFGHSARPRSVVWTPAAQARLVAAALAALGEGPGTIVGHSFGTLVAFSLALDHPETVSHLVLLGGYYYPTVRADALLASPPAVPIVGDAIRYTVSPLLGRVSRPALERQVFAPAEVSEGWRERFPFAMTLRPSQIRAAAAEAALMVPAAAALAPRLQELDKGLTVIAGDGDKVVDAQAQSVRLAEELGQAELILAAGAGHMVHHTAADLVIEAILKAARR